MTFSFTIAVPPQPKQRPRLGRGGHVFTPFQTREYERVVGLHALAKRPRRWPMDVRYAVAILVPRGTRGDLDNIAKAICDGMNGVAFADDRQIDWLSIRRMW